VYRNKTIIIIITQYNTIFIYFVLVVVVVVVVVLTLMLPWCHEGPLRESVVPCGVVIGWRHVGVPQLLKFIARPLAKFFHARLVVVTVPFPLSYDHLAWLTTRHLEVVHRVRPRIEHWRSWVRTAGAVHRHPRRHYPGRRHDGLNATLKPQATSSTWSSL